ncbi:MAG: hypothetical protein OEX83_01965 [Gammaproteobacteria bacterium]|nr:hypothetical protein [Gammaproteobacteria bacterium]
MSDLQLDIPNLNGDTSVASGVDNGVLQEWLAQLRLTDVEESARLIISSITQYNQRGMDPVQRVEIMNLFAPIISQLVEALRAKLKGSSFPLSSKNLERAEFIKAIMQGMANGFKIAVLDLDTGKGAPEKISTALLNATHSSIKYLAEQLLSAWLIYYPEPQGTWKQIHRLYRYAEEIGIQDKVLPAQADEAITANSIQHLYKRIILLAISNPYHLMEGEAAAILDYLNNWATKCSITPYSNEEEIKGQFYVDLESESPPCYASDYAEHRPKQGRVIGVDALASGLSGLIHKISEQSKDKNMSLKDRMKRDMLIRLQHAWGGRTDRQAQRFSDSEKVLLSLGLGASHYFVSDKKEFEPEKDEITMKGHTEIGSGLSLMPLDDDDWKKEELKGKMEAGVTQHRVSSFDDKGADAWEKINATRTYHQSILENTVSKHTAREWSKFNESQGGLGLSSSDISEIKIRVGDLVAYSKDDGNGWVLGALRWLNNKENQALDLGIKTISEVVFAAGARSIAGVGEGGEYFRAFTMTKPVNGQETQAIIVPANIFDNRSELIVNQAGELKYIRLLKLIDTTSSYSQFQFEIIAKPETNPYLNKYLQNT